MSQERVALWNIGFEFGDDFKNKQRLEKVYENKGNRYGCVLSEKGTKPLLYRALSNRLLLLGSTFYLLNIFSKFIYITNKIYGYKSYEAKIREKLTVAGLYEAAANH